MLLFTFFKGFVGFSWSNLNVSQFSGMQQFLLGFFDIVFQVGYSCPGNYRECLLFTLRMVCF